MVFYELKQA